MISAITVVCGLLGWWMVEDLQWKFTSARIPSAPPEIPEPAPDRPTIHHAPHRGSVTAFSIEPGLSIEAFASSRPNQLVLRFPTPASYGSFLSAVDPSPVSVIAQLDRLRAVRVEYSDPADLSELLDHENLVTYNSLPAIPPPIPPSGIRQAGLVRFGGSLLEALGVGGEDNSEWGRGVRIAVIDSGILPHPGLRKIFQAVDVNPDRLEAETTSGHGTAVASLIAGTSPMAPGIAPAAELISIRVTDDNDRADAFSLAAGLLAASDAGAQIINVSMGSVENNPLMEEAVKFAQDHGALIIAAAGNSGQARAAYPAAYPGVISVGAVDAAGTQLEFSNYDDYLSLVAPGLAINAAWADRRYIEMSGTSAAAPVVTGVIAATMSNGRGTTLGAAKAADIVFANLDEAGLPGPDSQWGAGILNLGRIMRRYDRDIVDAAITHQQLLLSPSGSEIRVTIQNRGTVPLVNTFLRIATPAGERQVSVPNLLPGNYQTLSVTFNLSGIPAGETVTIRSSLELASGGRDIKPADNVRTDSFDHRLDP